MDNLIMKEDNGWWNYFLLFNLIRCCSVFYKNNADNLVFLNSVNIEFIICSVEMNVNVSHDVNIYGPYFRD